MATWLTLGEARGLWRDAPADDATLGLYLESAKVAVVAFAPPLDPGDTEPPFPDPLRVSINEAGIVGTVTLTREPRQVLRVGVSLTNETGADVTDWLAVSVTAEPAFVSAYQCSSNYGSNGWAYLPVDAVGTFGHTGGTWADGALVEFDLLATPATEDPEPIQAVPEAYRLAQLMQARNTFNAGKASPGGGFDGSEFGITTMPLDWQVKQLLRPQRAIGAIA